ncbi:hypothetical protein J7077_000660 [Vibrio parahaemolyticus]|nr:hypothetical protein [Vibrio parahaemolyticus]EHH3638071.1 hypothetical protein [Vibrio parahaemolyticus]EIU6795883.1 hypothetical protein [Vibrio parahaemolyticus]ELA9859548.1 hypothetical protein [Vibrio parahaemolyticus]
MSIKSDINSSALRRAYEESNIEYFDSLAEKTLREIIYLHDKTEGEKNTNITMADLKPRVQVSYKFLAKVCSMLSKKKAIKLLVKSELRHNYGPSDIKIVLTDHGRHMLRRESLFAENDKF